MGKHKENLHTDKQAGAERVKWLNFIRFFKNIKTFET